MNNKDVFTALNKLFDEANKVAYADSSDDAEYYTLTRLRPTLLEIDKIINSYKVNANTVTD